MSRPRKAVGAFDGVWVAADWHEASAPRSFSGFFLPLIFSGLSASDTAAIMSAAPAKHFGGNRRAAAAADLERVQPFWSAVFSGWDTWVGKIRAASEQGLLREALVRRGVSSRCSSLLPLRCHPDVGDVWVYGAVPHIKPDAQNDLLEAALGPVDAACFYASVASLFEK